MTDDEMEVEEIPIENGESNGSVANIAGFWNASSAGDFGREEFWEIEADGNFAAYVYTEQERLFDEVQQVGFDVFRCFDAQAGTITALGNNQFTIDGRFNESGTNVSYELVLNDDDTLQAIYTSDVIVCDQNGCFATNENRALPRMDTDFSTSTLFTCPTGPIPSVDPLINGETASTSTTTWNCSFLDQANPELEPVMSTVIFGGDGSGLVAGERAFSWITTGFNGVSILAGYDDGSFQSFRLENIITYMTDDVVDRFTALDESIRPVSGTNDVNVTFFEMDCSLQPIS